MLRRLHNLANEWLTGHFGCVEVRYRFAPERACLRGGLRAFKSH
jgi:hypothetical protein